MLLAEIHGKSNRDLEELEDLLTSSVFGHLRLVQPPLFWLAFLERARTVEEPVRTLTQVLSSLGVGASRFSGVTVRFWPCFSGYEPDILVQLFGDNVAPITLLIEVKLHAGKSGTGEFDQLAKYLMLLNDPACPLDLPCDIENRFLVYLTKNFSVTELRASVGESKILRAQSRMFGIEWNDIADIATAGGEHNHLLDEVGRFLKRRGFERFHGFGFMCSLESPSFRFYQRRYFEKVEPPRTEGRFYGT